jgi:hypothetical protein
MNTSILEAAYIAAFCLLVFCFMLLAVAVVVMVLNRELEYRRLIKRNRHEMIARRMKIVIAKLKIGRKLHR